MAVWSSVFVGHLAQSLLELLFFVGGRNIVLSISAQKISPGSFFSFLSSCFVSICNPLGYHGTAL